MRTEYIDYILEVARSGSITAAASKLYLQQTTLSTIVASVEKELKTKLFQRTRRGVTLTPDGEAAIAVMEQMSNTMHSLHNLQGTTTPVKRIVHLVAYPTACNHLGLFLAKKLAAVHKDVVLSIHETMYNKIISQVTEGIARIAVGSESSTFFTRQMEAQESGLRCEIVHTDQFCLVVAQNSPFARRQQVDVAELLNEHLALSHNYPRGNDSSVGQMFRAFRKFTMLTNNQIIKQAVAGSNMVAIMPFLELVDDIYMSTGALRAIPISGFPTELTIYIVYDELGGLSPLEQMLLGEIRRYYLSLPSLPWEHTLNTP